MYRVKRPTSLVLIIQHHPWMQRCLGLLFVIGGLCVAYFVFPDLVLLRCERAQNVCFLEQSNLFRSHGQPNPLVGYHCREAGDRALRARLCRLRDHLQNLD